MGLASSNDTSLEILRPARCEATKPSSETALALVFRESLLDSALGKEIRVEVVPENTPSVVEAAIASELLNSSSSLSIWFQWRLLLDKNEKKEPPLLFPSALGFV
ncbi:hypothetical protein PanWU01x14_355190, partial [Parasponia andersonii]